MDMNLFNETKVSSTFSPPTIIWCLLMPLVHFLSLISNILCIIVFCSKTFIHKPIAIYFICLLISDSTTLLIGYTEMLDRESTMTARSSVLCMFNTKVVHQVSEFIYSFMGKFCMEWVLYKVLWTRASTILLAILSIQRSRTFFSLSYHESRLCALFACLISVLIALLITCFEWIGVQCERSTDPWIYWQIFQSIMKKNSSKEFYFNALHQHSMEKYSCLMQSFALNGTNQFNCSITEISSEFYSFTQSLLSDHDPQISENLSHILYTTCDNPASLLTKYGGHAKAHDLVVRLFEKRPCQLTSIYSIYWKLYDFLHSLSFGFNRHTLAIFFGNALPSFVVFLANLLSLKVIYFSNSLKYLKQCKAKNRRHRRIQNDLRAFLVILIESFSVIAISWGIPIFLTMFHCRTLYVVSMSSCPAIKKFLAGFLFTDLFNSSTNCLLYSLSGKLFRRKFISLIKLIFSCGRSASWPAKRPSQQLEIHPSIEPSANLHYGANSKRCSCRHSEPFLVSQIRQLQQKKLSVDTGSLSAAKLSDEQETEGDSVKKVRLSTNLNRPRTFFFRKFRFFASAKPSKLSGTEKAKKKGSCSSSSSGTTSNRSGSLRPNPRCSLQVVLSNSDDSTRVLTKRIPMEHVTNL